MTGARTNSYQHGYMNNQTLVSNNNQHCVENSTTEYDDYDVAYEFIQSYYYARGVGTVVDMYHPGAKIFSDEYGYADDVEGFWNGCGRRYINNRVKVDTISVIRMPKFQTSADCLHILCRGTVLCNPANPTSSSGHDASIAGVYDVCQFLQTFVITRTMGSADPNQWVIVSDMMNSYTVPGMTASRPTLPNSQALPPHGHGQTGSSLTLQHSSPSHRLPASMDTRKSDALTVHVSCAEPGLKQMEQSKLKVLVIDEMARIGLQCIEISCPTVQSASGNASIRQSYFFAHLASVEQKNILLDRGYITIHGYELRVNDKRAKRAD